MGAERLDKAMMSQARKRVTAYLRTLYDELIAILSVDTEDFYKRVMNQASTSGPPNAWGS
jgi:hypothetical protein